MLGRALRRRGSNRFGGFTVALGLVAALGGVDRWQWMLPWIPVPPSLIRIVLELIWLPWALILILRAAPSLREDRADLAVVAPSLDPV
jgi:hypothetical protein